MKLQSILFPNENICNEESLYLHRDGSLVLFDGYFNLFYLEKHHRYCDIDELGLELKVCGIRRILVYHDRDVLRELEADGRLSITLPYDEYPKGVFWFAVEPEYPDGEWSVEGHYEGSGNTDGQQIELAVNICTYKREPYVVRNMKSLIEWTSATDIEGNAPEVARHMHVFMFQLTMDEVDLVKSQNATSSWGGKRKLPYAFTEQGIYMLATVLRGELAEQQSIFIMRAFKEMRHYIRQNQQFVTQSEMSIVTAKVSELSVQMAGAIDHQKKTDKAIEDIQKSIDTLNENFVSDKDFKNFIIYKGQKFEADAAYIDIYQQATKSIYVVDDYMNTKSLQLLSQKKPGVEVVLFTENGHGKRGFLTTSVVNDFLNQYPPLRIKPNPDCHDRLIVLDYGLPTEQAFHCGASSKDAGRKLCAINKVESVNMVRPVIDGLLKLPDKNIQV